MSKGSEIAVVNKELSSNYYGENIFSHGDIVIDEGSIVPDGFDLFQNYPNPFNPNTSISFVIPSEGVVTLNVFDVTGRIVAELVNESLIPSAYTVTWDGNDLTGAAVSAGMYIYTLKAEGVSITRKMVLMK